MIRVEFEHRGGKRAAAFLDRNREAVHSFLSNLWDDVRTRRSVLDGERFAYADTPLVGAAHPVPESSRTKGHDCDDDCLLLTLGQRPSKPKVTLHLHREVFGWTHYRAGKESGGWPTRDRTHDLDGWLRAPDSGDGGAGAIAIRFTAPPDDDMTDDLFSHFAGRLGRAIEQLDGELRNPEIPRPDGRVSCRAGLWLLLHPVEAPGRHAGCKTHCMSLSVGRGIEQPDFTTHLRWDPEARAFTLFETESATTWPRPGKRDREDWLLAPASRRRSARVPVPVTLLIVAATFVVFLKVGIATAMFFGPVVYGAFWLALGRRRPERKRR